MNRMLGQVVIGRQARLTPVESIEALDAAVASWSNGKGEWATSDMKVFSQLQPY